MKLFSRVTLLSVVMGLLFASHALAASFQQLGSDPEARISAKDLSADGSVVVGSVSWEAFRWTKEDGIVILYTKESLFYGSCSANCVSPDGSIINIICDSGWMGYFFRWTEESGLVSLFAFGDKYSNHLTAASADGFTVFGWADTMGYLGSDGTWAYRMAVRWSQSSGVMEVLNPGEMVTDVTHDGSISVGYKEPVPATGDGDSEACIWTPEGGTTPIGLGYLPGESSSHTSAVSGDGSVVVGGSGGKAFHWKESTGMVNLGVLSGTSKSAATDVSADGQIIVGNSINPDGVFIWDATNGMRDLQDLLTSYYHLDLSDWKLTSATAISGDGKTIIGEGINPDGNEETWIASINDCDGTLEVGIEPTDAVSAGARWRVDEGAWMDADEVHSCLDSGNHTVEFKVVAGWTFPGNQTVEITEDQQAAISGTYAEVKSEDGEDGGCFIGTVFW